MDVFGNDLNAVWMGFFDIELREQKAEMEVYGYVRGQLSQGHKDRRETMYWLIDSLQQL